MVLDANVERLGDSIDEGSKATGLSKPLIRGGIRNGKLRVTRFGRRVLVLANHLQDYLVAGSRGKEDWKR